jgi:hypothetical protein
MLIAMLAVWAREGKPVYSEEEAGQTIAYVLQKTRFTLPLRCSAAHAITDTSPILVPRA